MAGVRPTTATFVRSAKPATVHYQQAESLYVLIGGAGTTESMWFWPVGDLTDKILGVCPLRLVATGGAWPDVTLSVSLLDNKTVTGGTPGSFPRLTFNARHRVQASPVVTKAVTGVTAGTVVEIDVAPLFAAVAAGQPYYGLRITTNGPTVSTTPWRAAKNFPTLEVVTSKIPGAPAGLWPAGGAVSKATYVAAWNAVTGADEYQVQVATDEDFADVLHTSAWIPETGLDLAASGWAGQAIGAHVWWRVRARNALGVSEWSPEAEVSRTAKPTVDLTTPTGETADPTPLHEWAVAPSTAQLGFQLVTSVPDGAVLSDSRRVAGSATTYEPTKGRVSEGPTRSRLRVFTDHLDVPGDPNYVEVTRDWTYSPDDALQPPVQFGVAQHRGGIPLVSASWEHDEVPDEWLLTCEGRQVARFDGSQFRDGLRWEFPTWLATPNIQETWRIAPVYEGRVGAAAEVTVRTHVVGVHLVDVDSGEYLNLLGDDPVSASESHSVATQVMLDGRTVADSFGRGGLVGEVSGILAEQDPGDERPWSERRQVAEAFLADTDRRLRQIWTAHNIPVRAWSMSRFGLATSFADSIQYAVGWSFAQAGEVEQVSPL